MINSAMHYDKDRTCTPEENQVFEEKVAGIGGTARAISKKIR